MQTFSKIIAFPTRTALHLTLPIGFRPSAYPRLAKELGNRAVKAEKPIMLRLMEAEAFNQGKPAS